MFRNYSLVFPALAVALAILAPSAQASLTPWYPSPYEQDHDQVLENLYGFANLERIDDDLDQLWQNNDATAWAKARFALDRPSFGFLPNAAGGSFNTVFTVTGMGTNPSVTPSGAVSFPPAATGNPFRFALLSTPEDTSLDPVLWSSLVSDNMDEGNVSLDHMITYKIVGSDLFHDNSALLGNYVLTWEDKSGVLCDMCDRDFQDLIVEVHGVDPYNPPEVPEPATALLLGLGGLGALTGRLRRRRRENS